MAYATSEELEDYVGHTVDTDRAVLLLDIASAAVADAAGNDLDETSDTETLDGSGAPELLLPRWPVTAVASVVEDGDTLTFDDDYRWSRAGVLERTNGCWTGKQRAVQVTYTAGYQTVPDGINGLTLQVAGRLLINPQLVRYAEGAGFSTDGIALTKGEKRRLHLALR